MNRAAGRRTFETTRTSRLFGDLLSRRSHDRYVPVVGFWARLRCAHQWGVGAGLAVGVMLLVPAGGWAQSSIATAPIAQLGQQQFGNTADGSNATGELDSFWILPVTAGDAVTIDWEAQYGNVENLRAYPVGTNDFNVNSTYPITFQDASENGKDEFQFTAPRTGTMPLDFTCCPPGDFGSGGPYDFTASVQHVVRLSVPAVNRLGPSGSVKVGVHNPDGVTITDPALSVALQLHGAGQTWSPAGSASPSSGTATIPYTVPRSLAGQTLYLRVIASGPSYITEASTTQRPSAPPPPSLRILTRTARVNRESVRLSLSCRGVFWRCTGALTLRLGGTSLGSAPLSIPATDVRTVVVKLDHAGLLALDRAAHHELQVTVHVQGKQTTVLIER